VLDIEVLAPTRTETLYAFRCLLRPQRSPVHRLPVGRLLRRASARTSDQPSELRFGFRATNFAIPHHEVWDGLYPLFFLTRNGGPLFNSGHDRARIRFGYPIPSAVRDFYVRRAADFGIEITIDAATSDGRLDRPTDGTVLAFGGGKESRLLLGILREVGLGPRPVASGAANATDIPEALVTEALSANDALADRVMPSLMALGRHLHVGLGLGTVHLETPWQQYYDLGSAHALAALSELLATLGIDTHVHAVASVLPYNITQRILHDRYPDLYAGQVSVPTEDRSEKNLHVALLKVIHGIPFTAHCSEPLFGDLLRRFVRRQTSDPTSFGFRNHRETVRREMRAIVWRMRDDPLFAPVRDAIPPDWEGPWIDFIHTYVWPSLDPALLGIYRQYAPTVEEAPDGTPIRRVRV
jgi:hypothetical protein